MRTSAIRWVLVSILAAATMSCASTETEPASDSGPQTYREIVAGTAVEFDMVWIEEGGFWIGRTEVTWDEYLPFCDFDETDRLDPRVDAITRPSKPLDVYPYDRDWGAGQRPAVGMSRNAARKYCEWLSARTGREYRLPTEAEWEAACIAESEHPLRERGWFAENSHGMTEEVATLRQDANGLYDMLGNLWEYCDNDYDPSEPGRPVLRGGSWKDSADALTRTSRIGFEDDWLLSDPEYPPGVWWIPDADFLGFRVVRSGPASSSEGATTSNDTSTDRATSKAR